MLDGKEIALVRMEAAVFTASADSASLLREDQLVQRLGEQFRCSAKGGPWQLRWVCLAALFPPTGKTPKARAVLRGPLDRFFSQTK